MEYKPMYWTIGGVVFVVERPSLDGAALWRAWIDLLKPQDLCDQIRIHLTLNLYLILRANGVCATYV